MQRHRAGAVGDVRQRGGQAEYGVAAARARGADEGDHLLRGRARVRLVRLRLTLTLTLTPTLALALTATSPPSSIEKASSVAP